MPVETTQPDSSGLTEPTLLIRRLVPADAFEATVAFYERFTGREAQLRFDYPAAGLRLATVSTVLVIGGDEQALEPFRATDFTAVVSSLDRYAARARELGGQVVTEPKRVPTGRNMLVRHPDGSLVEYVEHRP